MYSIGTKGVISPGTRVEIRGTSGDNSNREYFIRSLEDRSYAWIKADDFIFKKDIEMDWLKVKEALNNMQRT